MQYLLHLKISIVFESCTTWTLTKCIEKKLDGNYMRMLQAILNKSWKQHFTKQQLMATYHPSQRPSKLDEQDMWDTSGGASNVVLWTPLHGCASVGRPARTYLQQLCMDTGCSLEDLPEAMGDRRMASEREIYAYSMTWWWLYFMIFFFFSFLHWTELRVNNH